jgi:hypothetical protein
MVYPPDQSGKRPDLTVLITGASSKGFAVYVDSTDHYFDRNQSYARYSELHVARTSWRVSWIGAMGQNSGTTALGHTGWKTHDSRTIYTDVNTTSAQFKYTPNYVVSLLAGNSPFRVSGTHAVYRARKDGFRVYVTNYDLKPMTNADQQTFVQAVMFYKKAGRQPPATLLEFKELNASYAESLGWRVNWLGNLVQYCVEGAGSNEVDGIYQYRAPGVFKYGPFALMRTSNHLGDESWALQLWGTHDKYYETASDGKTPPATLGQSLHTQGTQPYPKVSLCGASWTGSGLDNWATDGWDSTARISPAELKNLPAKTTVTMTQVNVFHGSHPSVIVSMQTSSKVFTAVESGMANVYPVPDGDSKFTVYVKGLTTTDLNMNKWSVNYVAYEQPIDCKVSQWDTAACMCTRTCGGGTCSKRRFVVQHHNRFGTKCPQLISSRLCHTKPCPVFIASSSNTPGRSGIVPLNYNNNTACGSVTVAHGANDWEAYSGLGVSILVNTEVCKFTTAPRYFASLAVAEDRPSFATLASTSIYMATETSFRAFVYSTSNKPEDMKKMLATARDSWRLSWFAVVGPETGQTESSQWKQGSDGRLYIDVDTSAANFQQVPKYIVSVTASVAPRRMSGVHWVSCASAKGFRMYLTSLDGVGNVYDPFSPERMESAGWKVNWVGAVTQYCVRRAGSLVANGVYKSHGKHLFINGEFRLQRQGAVDPAQPCGEPCCAGKSPCGWVLTGPVPNKDGGGNHTALLYRDLGFGEQPSPNLKYDISFAGLFPGPAVEICGAADNWLRTSNSKNWMAVSAKTEWRDDATMSIQLNQSTFVAPAFLTTIQSSVCPRVGTSEYFLASPDIGASNLWGYNPRGFNIYIRNGKAASLQHSWNVNYLGFESPIDCQATAWQKCAHCSHKCGGGVCYSHREIMYKANFFGKNCPATTKLADCNTHQCPRDCTVSQYGKWTSSCPRCGADPTATISRFRTITEYPAAGGKPCPVLNQSKSCGNDACVGTGPSKSCGGVSSFRSPRWEVAETNDFESGGIFMYIETQQCNFTALPFYVTSLAVEKPALPISVGYVSITDASDTGFRVHVFHDELTPQQLVYHATKHHWRINWIGGTGKSCGETASGSTGWKQGHSPKQLYVDVTTTRKFDHVPNYVIALYGRQKAARALGAHAIYHTTASGFRVYCTFSQGDITPKQAETHQYTIVWMVHEGTRN